MCVRMSMGGQTSTTPPVLGSSRSRSENSRYSATLRPCGAGGIHAARWKGAWHRQSAFRARLRVFDRFECFLPIDLMANDWRSGAGRERVLRQTRECLATLAFAASQTPERMCSAVHREPKTDDRGCDPRAVTMCAACTPRKRKLVLAVAKFSETLDLSMNSRLLRRAQVFFVSARSALPSQVSVL